jgi:cell division transport system ATP-binding protein
VIHFENVTKEYARPGPALKDVSFHVRKGEFVFLTGHSGSGKTTTMKLIHMSERPTHGEVRVSGYSSNHLSEREVWKLRRRVGYVFQNYRLLPGRTASENVEFALEVTDTPRAAVRSKSQRLLAQVGLGARGEALVHELSGGEQQRVAIARALVTTPVVLLADEPTGNLDERATRGVMELFWSINALGMAVLMATHNLELVRRYPQARVLELDQGRLVYDSGGTTPSAASAEPEKGVAP